MLLLAGHANHAEDAMPRPEVRNLASQSPLGPESAWDEESLEQLAADIEAVSPPVTAEEAAALLPLLDRPHDDSIYGLLWAVLHLIESFGEAGRTRPAPDSDAPWLALLHDRWQNRQARST